MVNETQLKESQLNGNGQNGHRNGHSSWVDENPEDIVLFTSESVGEGHPGECVFRFSKFLFIILDAFF